MSVITALKKYVKKDVLETWLTSTFGERDSGVWSAEEIAGGKAETWKVTAPRAITDNEQIQLHNDSKPKRTRTFGDTD